MPPHGEHKTSNVFLKLTDVEPIVFFFHHSDDTLKFLGSSFTLSTSFLASTDTSENSDGSLTNLVNCLMRLLTIYLNIMNEDKILITSRLNV